MTDAEHTCLRLVELKRQKVYRYFEYKPQDPPTCEGCFLYLCWCKSEYHRYTDEITSLAWHGIQKRKREREREKERERKRKRENSKGPIIDPCGTPVLQKTIGDDALPTLMKDIWSVRYNLTQLSARSVTPKELSSLFIRMEWSMVPKVVERTRVVRLVVRPRSSASIISLTIF